MYVQVYEHVWSWCMCMYGAGVCACMEQVYVLCACTGFMIRLKMYPDKMS